MPGRQIDDAQAAVGEGRLIVQEQPRIVRAAMRDDVAHAREPVALVGVEPVRGDDSCDSAHRYTASVSALAAGAHAGEVAACRA